MRYIKAMYFCNLKQKFYLYNIPELAGEGVAGKEHICRHKEVVDGYEEGLCHSDLDLV